jgi:5-dehydro-2-deoxygluconokinase
MSSRPGPVGRFDVIAMGRSSIDLYSNDVGAPFPEITSFAAYVGGCPTNIGVGARRLGLRTALLTAVGDYPVGDFVLRFLAAEGLDLESVSRKSGTRTGAVLLGIEPPDRFPLVFYRDRAPDMEIGIDEVMAAPIPHARALVVTGTGLSREPSRSATMLAVERARDAGAKVILDLDLRADQWHDPRAFGVATRSLLPLVDVAIGTEAEVKAAVSGGAHSIAVTGAQVSSPEVSGDVELAVQRMVRSGPRAVVVKRGAEGASVYVDGDRIDAAAFPVDVLNVLGAGDAFASGFIYGLLHGWGWHKSARMGNATGAIVVTRRGCANFMPYESEVLQFIDERGGF